MLRLGVDIIVIDIVYNGSVQSRLSEVSSNKLYCFVNTLMFCYLIVILIPYYIDSLLIRKLYFDVC